MGQEVMRRKIRRFYVFRCCPGHWVVEITVGFEGNYEHYYANCESWAEAYDYALTTAKKWRYPEGWYA
jgi:hypothetical protein